MRRLRKVFPKCLTSVYIEALAKMASEDTNKQVYYMKAFREISEGKRSPWNWSAALLSTYWLQRKGMTKVYWTYIVLFLTLISLLVVIKVALNPIVFWLTSIVFVLLFMFSLGRFGNVLFYYFLLDKYEKENSKEK